MAGLPSFNMPFQQPVFLQQTPQPLPQTSPFGATPFGMIPSIGLTTRVNTNVANPATFSQPDQMVFLTQLLQGLSNVGRGNAVTRSYLQSTGLYRAAPLEEGVRVRQADEASYFQALGYEG